MTSLSVTIIKLYASFVISFAVTSMVLVYVFRTPHIILQDESMVDNQYHINTVSTLTKDFVSSVIILMIAQFIIYMSGINGSLSRIGIVTMVVVLISLIRHIAVIGNETRDTTTDERWYKSTTYMYSTLYDIIYMVTLYIVLTAMFAYIL